MFRAEERCCSWRNATQDLQSLARRLWLTEFVTKFLKAFLSWPAVGQLPPPPYPQFIRCSILYLKNLKFF